MSIGSNVWWVYAASVCIYSTREIGNHLLCSSFLRQDITKDVRGGEKKLKHLEAQSIDVMQNTSPLGAEKMKAELEELKKLLENIKLVSVEEEEKLLKSLQSENTYHTQARMLETDVQEFRKRLQRLGNHFEKDDIVRSDEDLISLWREYMVSSYWTVTNWEQRQMVI